MISSILTFYVIELESNMVKSLILGMSFFVVSVYLSAVYNNLSVHETLRDNIRTSLVAKFQIDYNEVIMGKQFANRVLKLIIMRMRVSYARLLY